MKPNKWHLLLPAAAVVIILASFFALKTTASEESNIYGQPIQFQATAYCYGSLTKTETVPMVGRTIAVDPDVIPLGSTVIIYTEYMDMLGIYQAEDTGRLIKGKIIDIYMEDKPTCIEWGRRPVYVQVIPDAVG